MEKESTEYSMRILRKRKTRVQEKGMRVLCRVRMRKKDKGVEKSVILQKKE